MFGGYAKYIYLCSVKQQNKGTTNKQVIKQFYNKKNYGERQKFTRFSIRNAG